MADNRKLVECAQRRFVRRLVREFGMTYPETHIVKNLTNVILERHHNNGGRGAVHFYGRDVTPSVSVRMQLQGSDVYSIQTRVVSNLVKRAVDSLDVLQIGILLSE